jgi:hypothetical protein
VGCAYGITQRDELKMYRVYFYNQNGNRYLGGVFFDHTEALAFMVEVFHRLKANIVEWELVQI